MIFIALPAAEPIHQDSLTLLKSCLSKEKLILTWVYNHIGYDCYHEGVAILSKHLLKPDLVSDDIQQNAIIALRCLAETVDGKEFAEVRPPSGG